MCPAFILTLTLKRAKLEYKIRSVSIDRYATINIGVRDRGQGGGGGGSIAQLISTAAVSRNPIVSINLKQSFMPLSWMILK